MTCFPSLEDDSQGFIVPGLGGARPETTLDLGLVRSAGAKKLLSAKALRRLDSEEARRIQECAKKLYRSRRKRGYISEKCLECAAIRKQSGISDRSGKKREI